MFDPLFFAVLLPGQPFRLTPPVAFDVSRRATDALVELGLGNGGGTAAKSGAGEAKVVAVAAWASVAGVAVSRVRLLHRGTSVMGMRGGAEEGVNMPPAAGAID